MKIIIGYPPLESDKGIPLLGQNRQFQWAKTPWRAYPVVPAYAATMLKNAGHEVFWLDGISEEWSLDQWLKKVKEIDADFILIETKTPVVKKHWEIINNIKNQESRIKVVLVGDHVTALPAESYKNCKVDYILAGGNYDFSLLNLIEKKSIIPNLDKLPFIDRKLTKWNLYAYKNSNYSQTPGTYTMFGRDCWWGKCTFCSWTTLFPGKNYRVMSPKRALDEIGYILENFPVKEIMDDSGTFPVGEWLREFCRGMIKRGYNKKIKLDCNMRFNSGLTQGDYDLMAAAGFRFLLYGLESANQETLDKLNKNLKVGQITQGAKMAKQAGLWPHVTAMVGYPWETKTDALKTLALAKELFKKGYIDSLQATVMIPYPGTPLFTEAKKNGWLKTLNWDNYDMKQPVLKTEMTDEEVTGLVRGIYNSIWSPEFIWRKLKEGLTNWDSFKYYFRMGLKFFSKRLDFRV
ncbi:MAG: cobalamin-dependent protein [bacterium]|nr:cobalamin-dependent protein [bacterium]